MLQEGVARLVKQMEVAEEKHKKWSRHRVANPDATVDYINDRNRRFNEKVARAYDKYTVEIRQNLERGTAL
jgi:pre-mRNA-splicing factor SYF2